MKNIFSILFLCLILSAEIFAQCPNCVIDNCSATLPDGGICNTILPDGTVNQPYDQDESFYMPPTIDFPPFTGISLRRIKIIGISGLPFGIDWESSRSASNDEYFPSNGDELGCVKFCGTPLPV